MTSLQILLHPLERLILTALLHFIGERTYEQYLKYFNAGANRYLLRHETANEAHYAKIHPKGASLKQETLSV